jgi:hypothetical protein
MDFYQRLVAVAFGEHATPDLSNVLQEARNRHQRWLNALWGNVDEAPPIAPLTEF